MKILEPFNEGGDLSLICEVRGGKPPPRVTWYLERQLLDDKYNREAKDVTVNRLVATVTRDFFKARLICRASNTELIDPVSSEIILDVNRKYDSQAVNCAKKLHLVAVLFGSSGRIGEIVIGNSEI